MTHIHASCTHLPTPLRRAYILYWVHLSATSAFPFLRMPPGCPCRTFYTHTTAAAAYLLSHLSLLSLSSVHFGLCYLCCLPDLPLCFGFTFLGLVRDWLVLARMRVPFISTYARFLLALRCCYLPLLCRTHTCVVQTRTLYFLLYTGLIYPRTCLLLRTRAAAAFSHVASYTFTLYLYTYLHLYTFIPTWFPFAVSPRILYLLPFYHWFHM